MMKTIFIIFSFALFIPGISFSQPQLFNYTTTNTGISGLPCNNINSMAEQSNGTLWFCTYNGIWSFDGNNWTDHTFILGLDTNINIRHYPFFQTYPNCICVDNEDNIWIADNEGYQLIKYNQSGIVRYSRPAILGNVQKMIVDAQGRIWLIINNRLFIFNGTQFGLYTVANGLGSDDVLALYKDSHDTIWVGGDYFLSKFNGTTFTTYNESDSLYLSSILDIKEDLQGNLWLATTYFAMKFDGSNFSYEYNTHTDDVVCDNSGNIWFTSREGLYRYNGTQWQYITTDTLNSYYFTSVFKDTQGNLWFPVSQGLIKYDMAQFTLISTQDGLIDNFVTGIREDEEHNLWFSTYGHICKDSANIWTPFYEGQDALLNFSCGGIMQESNGDLWFNWNGDYFNYGASGLFSQDNYFGIGLSMCEYAPDILMFGLSNGLGKVTRVENDYIQSYVVYPFDEVISSNCIFSQLKDHTGMLWLGTALGISYYDGVNFHSMPQQGLGDSIYDIVEDTGYNLWFASNHGVGKYDGSNWTFYYKADGLSDNEVHKMLFDSKGRMWFATEHGLSMLDTLGWRVWHQSDGLIYDRTLCLEEDHNGNIWVGTYYGVTELVFPQDTTSQVNPPKPRENQFSLDIIPNPTSGRFTIRTAGQAQLFIYDSSGMMITSRRISDSNSKVFDLSCQAPGLYLVKAVAGNKIINRKLVIMPN